MKTLANFTDQKDFLRRLERLGPDSRARWGKMTCPQMVCHLTDAFLVSLGEKRVAPASGILQRSVLKWVALSTPIPWTRGFPTRPELEQGRGGTPPEDFERDRTRLKQVAERFIQLDSRIQRADHPVFGQLTESEWMVWGYRHADHHLRQFGV